MLAKLLKGNQNFILIIIFFLWGSSFFFLNVWENSDLIPYISVGLVAVFVVLTALTFSNLTFLKKQEYFTFLWAVGTLCVLCCMNDLAFFGASFFVLVIINQFFMNAESYDGVLFNAFDLGFYMGIAIILHPPFWVFAVIFLVHYIFLGMGQIRFLLFYLLGIITLLLLSLEIIAILDKWVYLDNFLSQFNFTPYQFELKELFLLPVLLCALLGAIDYFNNLNRQSVAKKAVFLDGLLCFIGGILYIGIYGLNQGNALIFIVLPMALYTCNFLIFSKVNWKKETVLWVFFISFLLYRFHSFIEIPTFLKSLTF